MVVLCTLILIVYTTKPFPPEMIGKGLGLMKDELNGLIIKEAIFLGIKKYGYYYYDENNNYVSRSVFAGYTRDGLTFDEVKRIALGEEITKELPIRFYKSFRTLDINISSCKTTINASTSKKLVNNQYLPLHINNLDDTNSMNKLKNKLVRLFTKIFKQIDKLLNPFKK